MTLNSMSFWVHNISWVSSLFFFIKKKYPQKWAMFKFVCSRSYSLFTNLSQGKINWNHKLGDSFAWINRPMFKQDPWSQRIFLVILIILEFFIFLYKIPIWSISQEKSLILWSGVLFEHWSIDPCERIT